MITNLKNIRINQVQHFMSKSSQSSEKDTHVVKRWHGERSAEQTS